MKILATQNRILGDDKELSSKVFSSLIGKNLKDEDGREIGKIISFIINSSGEVEEALVDGKNEEVIRCPVERIKINQEETLLISDIEKKAEISCERFPILLKKQEILENLFKNKEILPEVYECLSAELDKSLNETRAEAQNVLEEAERQIQLQENLIKSFHLARAFLEMEHGIGNVEDNAYRQSLMSILREMKNASHRKMNLLRIKEKVSNIALQSKGAINEHETPKNESTIQKPAITVHMTNDE